MFERFPKLQIVSAENDVSWIPHFIYRLDHAYDSFRHFEGVNLSMLPSEYVKRKGDIQKIVGDNAARLYHINVN